MYDLTQQPISVSLSAEEADKVLDFCQKIMETKKRGGGSHKHTYQQFGNVYNSSSNVEYPTTMVIGFLGEVAIHNVFGIDYPWEELVHGDSGTDITINGMKGQLKAGRGVHLMFYSLHRLKADVNFIVFAEFTGNKTDPHLTPNFKIWGWCSRQFFMDNYKMIDLGHGAFPAVCFPEIARPLNKLLNYELRDGEVVWRER